MKPIELFLPIVMSLWGLTTLTLNLTKEINAIRDKILTGMDETTKLTTDHCSLMLRNDWKPYTTFLILISGSYGIITAAAPFFVDPERRILVVWLTSWFVSLFGFIMALLKARHAPSDYRMMCCRIDARRSADAIAENARKSNDTADSNRSSMSLQPTFALSERPQNSEDAGT